MMIKFYEASHSTDMVRWPDGNVEHMEVTHFRVEGGGSLPQVSVGWVLKGRDAFNRPRARVHVLVDGAVQAEFVGVDDYDDTGLLVSVLKLPGGNKHARNLNALPVDYQILRTATFSQLVRQKGAFSSLAVVVKHDDLQAMALYGFLRWRDRRAISGVRR